MPAPSHNQAGHTLDQGAYLFQQDESVKSIFVIEQGMIELIPFHKNGNSVVLQCVESQTILAEASMYSKFYHCDAIAVSMSVLLILT